MKPNHTQMEFEGDLFSGLEDPEATQTEARPYDKIIESRKNTTFAAEQIESQDEVQVVEKEPKNDEAANRYLYQSLREPWAGEFMKD